MNFIITFWRFIDEKNFIHRYEKLFADAIVKRTRGVSDAFSASRGSSKANEKGGGAGVNMPLFVLSIGGSLIVPDGKVRTDFLRSLKFLVTRLARKGHRFIFVTGGGGVCREYIRAASGVRAVAAEDLDWLGIHATRLNGHLFRTIFRDMAYPVVLKDPTRRLVRPWKEPVMVAAGWKPGWSTDYIAVRLAKRFGAGRVINMSNTDFLYERDPKIYPGAKSIRTISWDAYRRMIAKKWQPGLHSPFDPVASRLAHSMGLRVDLIGPEMKNFSRCLLDFSFEGTIIQG